MTEKDIPQMAAKLREVLGTIPQPVALKSLIQAYLDDAKLMADFEKAPAAMTFHHAYIGGLLEHTLNVLEVASVMVKFYPGLSRDLVLAGIFLHDIAKTWELSYDCAFGYTDGGYLIGHSGEGRDVGRQESAGGRGENGGEDPAAIGGRGCSTSSCRITTCPSTAPPRRPPRRRRSSCIYVEDLMQR